MHILDPLKPRFILDAYAMVGGQAVPLTEAQARKFSTPDQAREVFLELPDGCSGADIALGTTDAEFGRLFSNYQEPWDDLINESNLFVLVINCTVTVKSKQIGVPDVSGAVSFNIGELLAQRFLLGDRRNEAKLILDEIGQLRYELPK